MDDFQVSFNDGNIEEDEDIKKMNFVQRVTGIIVSPVETMKNLAAKPRILFPLLAIPVMPVLLNIVRFPLYSDTIRKALEKTAELSAQKGNPMSSDFVDKMLPFSAAVGLITVAIVTLFTWFVGTAILFGLMKAFGGKGSFKQVVSVSGYAYIVTMLSIIITLIVSFFDSSLKLDFSLGIFSKQLLSGMEGTFLYGLLYVVLTSFSVFTLWNYLIVGIGICKVSKLSKTKVIIIIAIIFTASILFSGVMTGISEASGSTISSAL